MTTIMDEAREYVPLQTKNISDLSEVEVNLEIKRESFTLNDERTGKERKINVKYIVVNNEKYRVPDTVLQQLQVHAQENQGLKKFKVLKQGSGLQTKYTVIPIIKA